MKIRRASSSDIPAILAIERASDTAAHWTEEEYERVWTDSSVSRRVFAAEENEVIGFLVARAVAGEWELENVAVKPEFRRRGVGRALLEKLLESARAGAGSRVLLEVRESNSAARKLYEMCGLRESGRRRSYYQSPTEDAILYDILV